MLLLCRIVCDNKGTELPAAYSSTSGHSPWSTSCWPLVVIEMSFGKSLPRLKITAMKGIMHRRSAVDVGSEWWWTCCISRSSRAVAVCLCVYQKKLHLSGEDRFVLCWVIFSSLLLVVASYTAGYIQCSTRVSRWSAWPTAQLIYLLLLTFGRGAIVRVCSRETAIKTVEYYLIGAYVPACLCCLLLVESFNCPRQTRYINFFLSQSAWLNNRRVSPFYF